MRRRTPLADGGRGLVSCLLNSSPVVEAHLTDLRELLEGE